MIESPYPPRNQISAAHLVDSLSFKAGEVTCKCRKVFTADTPEQLALAFHLHRRAMGATKS